MIFMNEFVHDDNTIYGMTYTKYDCWTGLLDLTGLDWTCFG
jgi:hypothetical protein